METVDVAVNVFAKPFQTALSLLSLLACSGRHVDTVWLQFEPAGSKFDEITTYHIADYLKEQLGARCRVFQPDFWLARHAVEPERIGDVSYRMGIRYQYAFEQSGKDKLFLMHNDVLVLRDILGPMLEAMGDSFAIGAIGQCWNCPASHGDLMRDVLGRGPCTPSSYADFQPGYDELRRLYSVARERGIFLRPYDEGFDGMFDRQPWPLPECRVSEWACLLDLGKTRPLCIPQGDGFSPGAFRQCGTGFLDTGVAWFRDMHREGLRARNFDIRPYLKHWVGTGNKTRRRYSLAENNALILLRKHYPRYLEWLSKKCGRSFL